MKTGAMTLNRLRKRYVETSRGLIHLQEAGTGGPALVLITLTSFSAPLLGRVLPLLAEKGWHAVALDLMGYGRSDKRHTSWRVEEFADNMLEAIAACDVEPVGISCGHFSSWIGIEIAARKALRSLKGLSLDGTPRFTPEERALKLAEGPPAPQPWDEQGSHALAYWQKVWRILHMIDPARPLDAVPTEGYRDAVMALMEASVYEPNTAMTAAWFEIEKRLALIDVPTQVMCSDTDWNLKHHDWMVSMLRHARPLRMPGVNPVHAIDSPQRAGEYAGHLHAFFSSL
jgi:pimeloyl-ACP methyl ester carboxylesterase